MNSNAISPTSTRNKTNGFIENTTIAVSLAAYLAMTNLQPSFMPVLANFSNELNTLTKNTVSEVNATQHPVRTRRDFTQLYQKIANDKWFKTAYTDKSLGEIVSIEW